MPPKSATTSAKPQAKTSSRHKAAAKPRAPVPVPEKLKRLFKSLCGQIDGGHLRNAVKTCDKSAPSVLVAQYTKDTKSQFVTVLRLAPDDQDALQTKLFLLLQTEQYSEALALVDKDASHLYEKAYTLYRLQHEDDARGVLDEVKAKDANDRGAIHLEAQMVRALASIHASVMLI